MPGPTERDDNYFSSNSRNARETNPSIFQNMLKACGLCKCWNPSSDFISLHILTAYKSASYTTSQTHASLLIMPAKRSEYSSKRQLATGSSSARAGQRSVCTCILIVEFVAYCLKLLLVTPWQKKGPCTFPGCGKVVRLGDMHRHMKEHDPNAEFVLLFPNSLFMIDTYFIGDSHVLSQAVITKAYRSPTRTFIFSDSVYYLFIFFPPPLTMSH